MKDHLIEHIISAVIAVGLVVVVMAAYAGFYSWANRPATFMTVDVVVPDHSQGEDPKISYKREIYRITSGVWAVEISCIDCIEAEQCSGGGSDIYTPIESGAIQADLSWYMGKQCNLNPGNYVLTTYWNLTDEKGYRATVSDVTEPFMVLP